MGGDIMIDILSNNLFHAINTKNQKLLDYLIDDDCILMNFDDKSVLGKNKVICQLNNTYNGCQIDMLNHVKDDKDTSLIAYKLIGAELPKFGSLVIKQNVKKKICFVKNIIIQE